jgi:hypothetical protein
LNDDLDETVDNAFSPRKVKEMHDVYSDRLAQYLSLTESQGLKPRRALATKAARQGEKNSDHRFKSKSVQCAVALYENHGATTDLAEVVLSAMVRSSEDEDAVFLFLSSVLEECSTPSALPEPYVFRVARMLARDRYFQTARLLLDRWNPNDPDSWTERTLTVRIQVLAALSEFRKAKETLELGCRKTLLSEPARRRLEKRVNAEHATP